MLIDNSNAKRLAIFFFYDRGGIVDSYVPYLLEDLKKNVSEIFVVCNGKLKEEGKTIVFISHSLPQVREFCDSAMWLEGGQMREYGDIDTVCDHYAEYIETYNKLTKAQKKAERDEKFKERIIKNRKVGLFDRLFG